LTAHHLSHLSKPNKATFINTVNVAFFDDLSSYEGLNARNPLQMDPVFHRSCHFSLREKSSDFTKSPNA